MSIFGSIGRAIGGAVTGFVRGGPLGAVTGAVAGVTSRGGGGVNLPAPPPMASPFGAMPWPGTGANPGVQLFNAGYQGPGTGMVPYDTNPNRYPVPGGGGIVSPMGTQTGVPKGYHINRSLERAARSPTPGNVRRAQQVVRAVVKNQRMNVLNPRALKRAERRAKGFIRFAKHIVKYYQPRQPKGRPYIKSRRKAK